MRNRNVWNALFGLACLSACNGGDQFVASKYVKSQLVVASQGGTVTVTAAESPVLAGTQVVIPPNALSSDVRIIIGFGGGVAQESSDTPVSGLLIPTGGQQAGPIVYFGPEGTTFNVPVSVTVPFTSNPAVPQSRLVVDALEGSGTSPQSHQIANSALQVGASTLTFPANGFTQFGADYLPPLPDGGACDGGLTLCGGSCTDTTSDSQNCGDCGVQCAGGVCQSSSCIDAGSGGGGCVQGQTVQADAGCCWGSYGDAPCGQDGTTGNADCCDGLVCNDSNVCIYPDAGPGGPDAGCFTNQTACVYNTDCCSGNCSGNAASGAFCAPAPDAGPTCFGVGTTCYGDLDCCSQFCNGWDAGPGGSCTDPTVYGCVANGAACAVADDCCSGDCGVLPDGGQGCVESGDCRHETNGCNLNSECCTGYCQTNGGSGKCVAVPYCLHTRATCGVDFDCCSGWCVAGSGPLKQCADPLGTGSACTEDMLACTQNSDCCTAFCDGLAPPDALVGYCGNGNGSVCAGTGIVCSQSSDCCTGNCASVVDAGLVCGSTAGCVTDYASCSIDSDCCNGFCSPLGTGGAGVCVPLCGNSGRGAGAFCSQNSDCCDFACSNNSDGGAGACELQCSLFGQSCYDDSICCVGFCSLGLVNSTHTCIGSLADAGERCHWDNWGCSQDSDCCSGTCALPDAGALPDGGGGGICTESFFSGGDGGYVTQPCLPENSPWDGVTGGCCSQSALGLSDGGFVCVGEVCLPENATCYNDYDCCTQYCQGWDAGVGGTCLPQGYAQCAFGGWLCASDSDCCSGSCVYPDAGAADAGEDAGISYAECTQPQECLADPSSCYKNYDCCGGLCVNVGDAGLLCQTPDGG